eukprot:7302713-Ditylum_brightwellii.AAC.1
MSKEVSSVKVPIFNGEEKIQSWWIQFQAYARVKQFSAALTVHSDLPTSEEEMSALDATSRKKQLAAGKKNMVAMAHLTMALGTEALLNK